MSERGARWSAVHTQPLLEGDMVDLARDLGAFMLERKKFWLLPIVGILGIFGGLIVLTEGSMLAPFIYSLW
jgi:Family of unknown function (DUF5989)